MSIYGDTGYDKKQKLTKEKLIYLNSHEIRKVKSWQWEKRRHFAMVSFYNGKTSLCNGSVAFKKAVCKCFMNKDV